MLNRTVERLCEHRHVSGLRELYIRLSAEAIAPTHVAHHFFRDRCDRLQIIGTRMIEELQADGRVPADADPTSLTILLMAVIDGLELQSFYRPDLDLPGAVEKFLDMIRSPESRESFPA